MKIVRLLTLTVLLFFLYSLETEAQTSQDNPTAGSEEISTKLPTHDELRVQSDLSRLKASLPADNSQRILSWSVSYMRWYGGNAYSGRRYYFSYGIGLGLSERGGRYSNIGEDSPDKNRFIYVQAPLIFRVSDDIKSGTLFIDGGVYYAVLVKAYYLDKNGTYSYVIGNNPSIDDWRRGDFGLRFDAGYQFKKLPLMAGLTTDVGLHNILPGDVEGYSGNNPQKSETITHRSVGLYIGYFF